MPLQCRLRGGALHNADERVLGHLYEKVGAAFCASVPAGTNEDHPTCQPNEWVYDVPKDPEQQARQLLREQRRLERHIEFLRNPIEPHAGNRSYPPQPRELRPYEQKILAAWDEAGTIPLAVDQLLAEYIHESVAAFAEIRCPTSSALLTIAFTPSRVSSPVNAIPSTAVNTITGRSGKCERI